LTFVDAAELLPWPDLTRTALAELRFNSIARWLPDAEAAELRSAFDAEMGRLYDARTSAGNGPSVRRPHCRSPPTSSLT
jgi:hypothetical protein